MQIIENWLKGNQNFTVGAMFYKRLGSNDAFKRLLEMGETLFAKNLLVTELEKLSAQGPALEVPVSAVQKETTEMPDGNDEVLKAIKNEWIPLFQRMNLLRHSLDKYGPDNSNEAIAFRMPVAAEIKQLEQQCMAIWAKRDYYLKEGKLPFIPETKLEIPTDPVKLAALINRTKRYICRYRKAMNDQPEVPKYAQLYNEYKSQHKEVTGHDYEEGDQTKTNIQ